MVRKWHRGRTGAWEESQRASITWARVTTPGSPPYATVWWNGWKAYMDGGETTLPGLSGNGVKGTSETGSAGRGQGRGDKGRESDGAAS